MPGTRKPQSLPTRLALSAIRLYQRHLSPIKGFSCAWRVATGGASCSAYGQRVIGRHGLRTGLALLERRLQRCGSVHRARAHAPNPVLHYQRGDCDCLDCSVLSSCDPGCACGGGACDWDWKRPRMGCGSLRGWRERRWLAKAARMQRERLRQEQRERFERERREREHRNQGPHP